MLSLPPATILKGKMDSKLLLQSGPYSTAEKTACSFSSYPIEYCPLEKLCERDWDVGRYVPVGTVEFVREFCSVTGLDLPHPISYPDFDLDYLHRSLTVKHLSEARDGEFVKPCDQIKLFTGGIKSEVEGLEDLDGVGDPRVWVSERVPFESEFRFYVHDFVTGPKVIGWSRYDDLSVVNPEPDIGMVEDIAAEFHEQLGPNAYSVDIGWRPDIKRWSLVEVNDGWALGFYQSTDFQSNPPTRQGYADMLVARWVQIVFCNIV